MVANRNGDIVKGAVQLSTDLWDTSLEMPPRQDAEKVDAKDADTPDNWVKRHGAMVRLTGRHPFNTEPPLKVLQDAGWITPPAIHVVRNHGAVPQLDYATHKLQVTGVPQPCEISMNDLTSGRLGEIVSIPVTFICAGNRRKEQNMTKKTVGFNWGCAAVGNSVWTGIRLCDLLKSAGITKASKEHRFVHFEGPEGELPQGKTGSYGTSIDIGWALDRERDVLLAFKQNGEILTPDHGAPLRTLLPGCIGGRMIKWLCKMHVSDKPSENHYHFFDNRVLPPHVDAEKATAEGWWYKPEYIINHMNINSAMFEPRHNSTFQVNSAKTLKVCGYAYTGGGNMIIRAEISLDSGRSWEIADLSRPEDEIAAARATDKHWCWAWWETEVDVARLEACEEICCRAFDSNQNSQPFQLTWNVMGMLSNTIFRIKVNRRKTETGEILWFEHPTMPGAETGGWMTEDAGKFDPEKASEASPGRTGIDPNRKVAAIWKGAGDGAIGASAKGDAKINDSKTQSAQRDAGKLVKSTPEWLRDGITKEEVKKHNDEKSCWFVVKDRVYDGTPFLEAHPGGSSSMLIVAGQEATEDFEATHSQKAWNQLEDYYLGPLTAKIVAQPSGPCTSGLSKVFLGLLWDRLTGKNRVQEPFLTKTWQQLPLVEKITVSWDTRIFRFGLPNPATRLGLPTGNHIFLKANINGEVVMRPYSPMTDDDTLGHVDFLVKVYFKGDNPRFPEGGKMSQYLESMKIGDLMDVRGPLGDFVYEGKGNFTWNRKPQSCSYISMIAGGTGLTPCYQVINAVLRDPADKTQVSLLYACKSPADILAREQLDELAAEHPDRFKLSYTVDQKPEGDWKGLVGFVDEPKIKDSLFPASDSTICLLCGPPIMVEKACRPNLKAIGYKEDAIFDF